MTLKDTEIDYWFIIEPYVHIRLTNQNALLYNTLDNATIESDKRAVVEFLERVLEKENCGVVLLGSKKYHNINIFTFIKELREKYMGDIIDINLSEGKPIQVLPFFNFQERDNTAIYKEQNFSQSKSALANLSEISIHLDHTTDIIKLIPFLQSLPEGIIFNILGNIKDVANYNELLAFFNQHPSSKKMVCSYTNLIALQPAFGNSYSYKISVAFPIDMEQWGYSRQMLHNQTLPFEYVFEVSSDEDYQNAEQLIEEFQLENYQFKPVYTGENLLFFEENVYLTKEEILGTTISIKDIFMRQAINIYDFGKINILANGDAFANMNHPSLGNIYTHSINEIVHKEVDEGMSWFRIRNQAPCNDCVYQWLCPPPSSYEIAIGRPNLCHINK
jgi:pseudo-rSAM protein